MESLNNEILLIIFEYLDNCSLAAASKVCESWNRLITSTSVLVRKPTVAIEITDYEPGSESASIRIKSVNSQLSRFPYRNFRLTSDSIGHLHQWRVIKILKDTSTRIEKLSVEGYVCFHIMTILNFSTQNLTHLIISKSIPFSLENYSADLPKLEYLKLRSWESPYDKFLEVTTCVNLKTLDIENCEDVATTIKFLKSLPNLRKLTTFLSLWYFPNFNDLPFKLTELVLKDFFQILPEILREFLLSQAVSLKKVTIIEKYVSASTVNFVLENLKNLRELKIFASIFNGQTGIGVSPQCESLKSLEINFYTGKRFDINGADDLNEAATILKILKKCRNLEDFKFGGEMRTNCPFDDEISLPCLKFLQLRSIKQRDIWNSLKMPNLENFTLEIFYFFPEYAYFLIKFLFTLEKLKNLQVNQMHVQGKLHELDVLYYQKYLQKIETFRIKWCKTIPVIFLTQLRDFEPEKFKLLEICYATDGGLLERVQADVLNLKFQTILRQFKKRESDCWEEEEELERHYQ